MTRKSTEKSCRPGRSALFAIAALLIASGAIRFASGTGSALARGVEEMMDDTSSNAEMAICETSESIGNVLAALDAREASLDTRESVLADRIAALSLAEQEIEKNLTALQAAETDLANTIAHADSAAEDDLARLTSVYENMKPKEAAALFEEMAPDFAAGFLGRMRPDAAAAIMAGLNAQTAYTISVMLAGRNANVPTQ